MTDISRQEPKITISEKKTNKLMHVSELFRIYKPFCSCFYGYVICDVTGPELGLVILVSKYKYILESLNTSVFQDLLPVSRGYI